MNPRSTSVPITKESIIEEIHRSENLPQPLFTKEGKSFPFVKEGKRDLEEETWGLKY